MEFMEWVQRRLIAHGFNPGLPDGIWGRNTRRATIEFQRSRNIPAEGVLNEVTIAALNVEPLGQSASQEAPKIELYDQFPWMALGLRKKGLHETRNLVDLRAFLKSDGKTLGDPSKLPWCGDFVETCLAVTLPEVTLPANPYLARNWLKFGHAVDPCYGAVLIFWRGSRGGELGHVAFYYAEDQEYYHVLGGNQNNTISVTRISKSRLLGARLPLVGGPYPRKRIVVRASGQVSTNEA